ncbi:MAG: alpha-1,6-mannosyltransferase [Watsoniomyces obsoletus]|nr:MAG: alpha-1,6-mannosyltransferase [Watsoniomyces obsoletus]
MKRKANEDDGTSPRKRVITSDEDSVQSAFREGLFDRDNLESQTKAYSNSQPYKHGVIQGLMDPNLLRSVRQEIRSSLSFTPKETDIYKIHQSGDLTNLDGLDDASLKHFPSLLKLRNALYSSTFRTYLSNVTSSGPLSGRKTDMAINVYTPGCHLLCHDDVIGSRRVSYILYLTDPDHHPWKEEWGGALRLYPTNVVRDEIGGGEFKIPSPDHSVAISPAFNQLSFFAVQPGESFHDVEEVYGKSYEKQGGSGHGKQRGNGGGALDGERVRIAISGWYHIPQEGEEGYIAGLEEQLAEKSSLMQLKGNKGNQFDLPQPCICEYGNEKEEEDDEEDEEETLSETDLDFLLRYIAPTYLTPDTLEEVSERFAEESCLQLERFLSNRFAEKLKTWIEHQELSSSSSSSSSLPESSEEIEQMTDWFVARPPHKHRFLYQYALSYPRGSHQTGSNGEGYSDRKEEQNRKEKTPLQELLTDLFPSLAFKKWLSLATRLSIKNHDLLARRFRRGKDYTLATGSEGEGEERGSKLEITLGVTPSKGWDDDDDDDDDKEKETAKEGQDTGIDNVGGYEVYMTTEENEDEDVDDEEDTQLPSSSNENKKTKKKKIKAMDPAIYRSGGGNSNNDEDDGILFSMPACWNRLGIVLRDEGVLKFVKYVSREARGDRWDVVGSFEFDDDEEDEEEEEEEGEEGVGEEG